MNVSSFGKKIAVQSGIGQLMDDLGVAALQAQEVLMLGGGNPAHIPEVGRSLRRSMTALLADGNRFEHAVGSYDPPEGNAEFLEALAHLLRGRLGWDLGRHNIALTSGSQLAFFILLNLFAGDYENGTRKKILFPLKWGMHLTEVHTIYCAFEVALRFRRESGAHKETVPSARPVGQAEKTACRGDGTSGD
jgi:valine--pyruvate aminotransferase